jgi:hypothetical protein
MRTTINIDDPILKELKALQQKEGKPLGRLISDLLAQVIGERKSPKRQIKSVVWVSKAMGARINLADNEALYTAMDKESSPSEKADET